MISGFEYWLPSRNHIAYLSDINCVISEIPDTSTDARGPLESELRNIRP
jgi:hypothetical protein